MILTEDYCSKELTDLLKEKGFECGATYSKGFVKDNDGFVGGLVRHEDSITHAQVMWWLREEKGMYISVVPDFNEYGKYPDNLYWFARVYDLRSGDYIHSTKLYIGSQEAFEAALKYCLTELI